MTALSPTLQLACELIERPSVTPADADCQTIMMARLSAIGFECQSLRFGDVDNFWAVHGTSAVPYTHLRAHETVLELVCRPLLERKNDRVAYIQNQNVPT